jgi:hypothetical protein
MIVVADIVDGKDVGVIERGDDAGLGQVQQGVFGTGEEMMVWHLDGDESLQLLVVGQINDTEASFA